jgi:hypothetical protein
MDGNAQTPPSESSHPGQASGGESSLPATGAQRVHTASATSGPRRGGLGQLTSRPFPAPADRPTYEPAATPDINVRADAPASAPALSSLPRFAVGGFPGTGRPPASLVPASRSQDNAHVHGGAGGAGVGWQSDLVFLSRVAPGGGGAVASKLY